MHKYFRTKTSRGVRARRVPIMEVLESRRLLTTSAENPLSVLAAETVEMPSMPLMMATQAMPLVAEGEAEGIEELMHEGIPDFAQQPTHRISTSGNWSQIAALNNVDQNSIVLIENGVTVNFDRTNVRVKTIGVHGTLRFNTSASTEVRLQQLLVYGDGSLLIGSRLAPVPIGVTTTITIGDRPLDLVNDPATAGNGVIVLGKINIFGQTIGQGYAALAQSPLAGDTTLKIADMPVGWAVGDVVSLPQTVANDDQLLTEEFRIVSMNANTITLDRAVGFNRPPAMDGDLSTVSKDFDGRELRGHVANLTRNVRIRSENANGNRGHFMALGRAEVDIRYAAFQGLGRTENGPDNSTTFDHAGNVLRRGTNQAGRYPIHLHHMPGPRGGLSADVAVDPAGINARQFRLIGNSISDGKKWGLVVHDAHYGLISGNVVHNVQGAGIITEEGQESFNYIHKNFVLGLEGDGSTSRFDTFGSRGSAFWARSGHNYWVGNIAAAAEEGYGLYISNDFGNSETSAKIVRVPKFPGADVAVAGEFVEDMIRNFPLIEFRDNQAYAIEQFALGTWDFVNGTIPEFTKTTVWNSTGTAFYFDYNAAVINRTIVRGNASSPTDFAIRGHNPHSITVKNFDIQQVNNVYVNDDRPPHSLLFENGFARNYGAFVISSLSQDSLPAQYVFRNVRFEAIPGHPLKAITTKIDPDWVRGGFYAPQVARPIQILIYAHQGNPSDNFRLYFNEQSSDYIIPTRVETSYVPDPYFRPIETFNLGGFSVQLRMPEAFVLGDTPGQTNAQSWATHRVAVLREVAPNNAIRREGLIGLTAPIPGSPIPSITAPLPLPVFWFKNNSLSGHSSTIDIVYKDFAALGASAILFSVDGAAWIRETDNDGNFRLNGVAPGNHRIIAALSGPQFTPWGTRTAFDISVIRDDERVSFGTIANQVALSESEEKSVTITSVVPGKLANGVRFSVISTNPDAVRNASIDYVSGSSNALLKYQPVNAGQSSLIVTFTNSGNDAIFGTLDDVKYLQHVSVSVSNPPFLPGSKVSFDLLPSRINLPSDSGTQSIAITGIDAGPGKLSYFDSIVSGNGLQARAISYTAGDKTGTLRLTPQPGFTGTVGIDIILRNPGPDRAYFTNDDLVFSQKTIVQFGSTQVPPPPTIFDPLPSQIQIGSDLGEKRIAIAGIKGGAGNASRFAATLTGPGISSASFDYRHGDASAVLRLVPVPGFRGTTGLEILLRNPGPDGIFSSADDVVHRQTVNLQLEVVAPPVSFDPLPALRIASNLGQQTFSITGISAGAGPLSHLDMITSGGGISSFSIDYRHGENIARVRLNPRVGFVGPTTLQVILRNPGKDGVYFSNDDRVHRQSVVLDLFASPVVATRSLSAGGMSSPVVSSFNANRFDVNEDKDVSAMDAYTVDAVFADLDSSSTRRRKTH